MSIDPHANGTLLHAGVPLGEAEGVVIMLHGRNASAENILQLADAIDVPGLAFLAPGAAGNTWYPNGFLAPRAMNEPWLSSALNRIGTLIEDSGLAREKIVLLGFSQGACLATEFVAKHPARYAGLIALTGGLIGPLGESVAHAGDLDGTPALFLSGDPDPHVPWSRVEESAGVLEGMGAVVSLRRYPGRPHTVSGEELELARRLIARAFSFVTEIS